MTMKEELMQLKSSLAELRERIEADDQEAITEGEKLRGEIEQKEAAIDAAEKKAGLLKMIGKKEEETTVEEKKVARNLGENFVEYLKDTNLEKRFQVSAPAFKAATDVQVSPSGATEYATTYDRNVVTGPRNQLVVRDLFGAEQISGSTLVYLVEGAMEGAPAVTAEGAKKAQIHFKDPTLVTVSLEKIAAFIKESDEYVKDYPFLASAINGRLLYELGLIEQGTLVSGLLATSGIQSDTTHWDGNSTPTDVAELILQAMMDVQEQSGYAADAILLNPADWYALRIAKNGNDEYYGGGFFGAQNVPNLWGVPVCVTSAIAAGKIVVGAFKSCGSVVTNGGVGIDMTNTDQDDFVKNLMTIRAEERLALAIRRPVGFYYIEKQ